GVALSADEGTAFVFCRSTDDLAVVTLDAYTPKSAYQEGPIPAVSLGKDPLPEQAALGRRLFYNAADPVINGGYACANCHPEGREDGHVWHEDEGEEGESSLAPSLHAYSMLSS